MKEKSAEPWPPELWAEIIKNSHSAQVIWAAAVLEDLLGHLIGHHLPKLSNNLKGKLFDGTGPLATFSARIDIAFAMGHIDDVTRGDLLHIKELRNEFAHSPQRLDLQSAEMRAIISKFAGYNGVKDPLIVYMDRVRAVVRHLKSRVPPEGLAKMMAAGLTGPDASPEKSE